VPTTKLESCVAWRGPLSSTHFELGLDESFIFSIS